jgi:hypothetical protein
LQELTRTRCFAVRIAFGFSGRVAYPPLLDLSEFPEFDEFLTLTHDDGESSPVHNVYLTLGVPEKRGPLLEEFAELPRRLRGYPPLAPYF